MAGTLNPSKDEYYHVFVKAGNMLVIDRPTTQVVVGPPYPPTQPGQAFPPPPNTMVNLQNGVPLQLWGTGNIGGINQHWKFVDLGGGFYGMQSRENGYFWINAVSDNAFQNGCKVQIWSYEFPPPDEAQWQLIDAGNGYVRLKNKKSGLLLNADTSGGNLQNGSRIQLWTQTGGENEVWQVVVVPGQ